MIRRCSAALPITVGIAVVALSIGATSMASAQVAGNATNPAPTIPATINAVQVRVRDSAGVVIPGAEVTVVRGLNDIRGSALSDQGGRAVVHLTVAAATDSLNEYQIVVRKIGYARADRFIKLSRDSALFDVSMMRAVQALKPVVVSADEDVKRKAYHIDADQIEQSTRPLFNAADVLAKMRPDMICGRDCRPMASLTKRVQTGVRKCPTLVMQQRAICAPDNTDTPPPIDTNVWVNGRHIRIVPLDEMALARQTGVLAGLKPGSMTVLSEILPEHIAEITYADEFDNTVGKPGSSDAIFIVLKPGVDYEPGAPSFVVKSFAQADTGLVAPRQLPEYRYRLLGLYDAETGDPIADAIVTDLNSGSFVKTSATGTISLVFLEEGTTPVRISRPGYRELSLAVEIAQSVKLPLTLVMERQR